MVVQVFVHLGGVASFVGVHGEHPVEELEEARGEVLPHAWRFGSHAVLPLHELIVVGVTERGLLPGKAPGEHAEEEDAHRPHVARRLHEEPGLIGGVADLGWGVGDASADAGNVGPSAKGHAEVNDFDAGALLVGQDDVLRLDVAMHQLLAVHELKGAGDLVDVCPRLGLVQADLGLDSVEEVAAFGEVLNHHV